MRLFPMDARRKAIIINEIIYWKESNLLPDQYCDYLLALYTEGTDEKSDTPAKKQRKNMLTIFFLMINLFLVPFIALIIINTDITIVLSITYLILALAICLTLSYFGAKVFLIDSTYISLALLLNIFLISLIVVNQWIPQAWIGLMIVFIQLVAWVVLGAKISNKWLMIMGILGLAISLIMLIL